MTPPDPLDIAGARYRPLPKISRIQLAVAEHFGIPVDKIIGTQRMRVYTRPRQVAMYLARTLTRKSYHEIGHLFGRRDHTTIMHGCGLIGHLRKTDAEVAGAIEAVSGQMQRSPDISSPEYLAGFDAGCTVVFKALAGMS